jgi:hypothetical protein
MCSGVVYYDLKVGMENDHHKIIPRSLGVDNISAASGGGDDGGDDGGGGGGSGSGGSSGDGGGVSDNSLLSGKYSDDFDVALTRLYIRRLQDLATHYHSAVEGYCRAVGWSDKVYSSACLLVYTAFWYCFNFEMILSLPFIAALLYMASKGYDRYNNNFVLKYVNYEVDKIKSVRRKLESDVYRPVGYVNVSVSKGKNIKSNDLNLPGRAYCTIYYSPDVRVGRDKRVLYEIGSTGTSRTTNNPVWDDKVGRVQCVKLDCYGGGSAGGSYRSFGGTPGMMGMMGGSSGDDDADDDVGESRSSSRSSNTSSGGGWGLSAIKKGADKFISDNVVNNVVNVVSGNNSNKMKTRSGIFTNVSTKYDNVNMFVYPVLQPYDYYNNVLETWKDCVGGIVVRVYLENVFNSYMDECVGEFFVNVKDLVDEEGREKDIHGFFCLNNSHMREQYTDHEGGGDGGDASLRTISEDDHHVKTPGTTKDDKSRTPPPPPPPPPSSSSVAAAATSTPATATNAASKRKDPMVHARLRLSLSAPNATPTPEERESSITIAEELAELMHHSDDAEGGGNIIGNSLDTVKGVMANAKYVQNLIGMIADYAEKVFNILNWADPAKTIIVFATVSVGMVLFLIFKTRHLILVFGWSEFYNGYWRRLSKERKKKRRNRKAGGKGADNAGASAKPTTTTTTDGPEESPILNLIASTPTNEDLRRFYFWESKRRGEAERSRLATKRRMGRLSAIWQAKWQGVCMVRDSTKFRRSFVVLQSHRISWWRDERDFDEGGDCAGQILFIGHCGLSGLSPLDLREMESEEDRRVCTNVFGRGRAGADDKTDQVKIMFKFASAREKGEFEDEVLKAMTKVD